MSNYPQCKFRFPSHPDYVCNGNVGAHSDYCKTHSKSTCVCGAQATHVCARSGCSVYLCDDCKHTTTAFGGVKHVKNSDTKESECGFEGCTRKGDGQQKEGHPDVNWMSGLEYSLDDVDVMVKIIGKVVEMDSPAKVTGQTRRGVSYDQGIVNVDCVAFDVFFRFLPEAVGIRVLKVSDPLMSDDLYGILADDPNTQYFTVKRREESTKAVYNQNEEDRRDCVLEKFDTLDAAIEAVQAMR